MQYSDGDVAGLVPRPLGGGLERRPGLAVGRGLGLEGVLGAVGERPGDAAQRPAEHCSLLGARPRAPWPDRGCCHLQNPPGRRLLAARAPLKPPLDTFGVLGRPPSATDGISRSRSGDWAA